MDSRVYLLKISGSIEPAKRKEFEKTIRFVFNMLPSGCLGSHLALDAFYPNHYYVLTLWRSDTELSLFKQSDEFSIITGSYDTLGFINTNTASDFARVQAYRIHETNL